MGRAGGACLSSFRFLGLLAAKPENNLYELAPFNFLFLIFCLLVLCATPTAQLCDTYFVWFWHGRGKNSLNGKSSR